MAAILESVLVSRVRQRADMEDNYFVSDIEVQTHINSGICELHDLLVQTYGQDYYVKSWDFNVVAGVSRYAINDDTHSYDIELTDFYKLRGMDAKKWGSSNTTWYTLSPFNFNERNLNSNVGFWSLAGLSNVRYRLVGEYVVFHPTPDSLTAIRMWYIPTAYQFSSTQPSTSNSRYEDINGYSEYVVIDAAIKCLQKEESDVQVLLAQKAAMKRRIEVAASNRDAGSPLSVSDVYRDNNSFWSR